MAANLIYESKSWFKSYEKGVPESIEYEELTMPDYLEKAVKDFPDDTAMVFFGQKLTYRQFKADGAVPPALRISASRRVMLCRFFYPTLFYALLHTMPSWR